MINKNFTFQGIRYVEKGGFDWAPYRFGSVGVDCIFTPRPTYHGMTLREDLADLAGTRLKLWPLWLMGDDEKYPGEWALWSKHSDGVFPDRPGIVHWIASGDVTVPPAMENAND